MNKLETITELLVNELTGFNEDVQLLKKELDRAEHVKVKFDVAPVEHFIKHLDSFQKRETQNREDYVSKLSRKIEDAKIYPKWAVITFIVSIVFSISSLLFGGYHYQNNDSVEKLAYSKGKQDASEYINLYFTENPKALESYKKWAESQ